MHAIELLMINRNMQTVKKGIGRGGSYGGYTYTNMNIHVCTDIDIFCSLPHSRGNLPLVGLVASLGFTYPRFTLYRESLLN